MIKIVGTSEQTESFHQTINIDDLADRVKKALSMSPDNLNLTVCLCADRDEVQSVYLERYQQQCDYKAFISLNSMTIWVSLEDLSETVLAHEIGHGVAEAYFGREKRPPYIIHELIAQYAEKHFND